MTWKKILRITGISLLWLVTILETMSMFVAGSGKFSNAEFWGGMFESWGYGSGWFLTLIGVGEMGGALLLLIPRTAAYGAIALGIIMLGALFTVVTKESGDLVAWPVLMNLTFLGIIGGFRWSARWGGRGRADIYKD